MSKDISNDLKTHMAQTVTALANCWKIERADSEEFFFTDHDVDIVYDGDTYDAASGMMTTAARQTRGTDADNMEAFSALDSDRIDADDIRAGLFDGATVDVFVINYEDVSMGVMYLFKGALIGRIETRDNSFVAEVHGLRAKLSQAIVELYSPTCRAVLGDARCGVNLASHTVSGHVYSLISRSQFKDYDRTETTDIFGGGLLTWTKTGTENFGLSMEVKSYDPATDTITLFEEMPYDIALDDDYDMVKACNKTLAACVDTFDNAVNFRGEPYVPGAEKIPLNRFLIRGSWRDSYTPEGGRH